MKISARFLSAILTLSMILVLTAGCGSGTSSGSGGAPASSADSASPAQTQTPAGGPDKVIHIAMSENAMSLDPHNQPTLTGKVFSGMNFETPVQFVEEFNDYIPWLCASYDYSEDGLTWTFKIREGIRFHNGEPMNADDWVCTFQRLIDRKEELATSVQYWNELESVRKIDDYTVSITTSTPLASMRLSLAKTYIIPDGAYNELGDALFHDQICYGTGPWIFQEWIDGQYSHYIKNEEYWNKEWFDSYYDEVYINLITEPSTAVAAHVAGDVQAFIASGGINPDMLPLYSGTEDKTEIISFASGNYDFLGLSFKEGSPFLDENVRWALEYCIDRQSIVDNILGGGEVPNSQVLSHCIGYDPTLPPYEYDPVKAKEYLDNSSYDGREIVLSTNVATMKGEDILLAISENMNEIGFNTRVENVETATLASMRSTGDYDIYMVTNMQSYGDPGSTFTFRILNDSAHSFYSGPAADALNDLIRQSNRELNPEKRADLFKQISRNIRENAAPHTYICQTQAHQAADWGVTGIELFVDGTYRLSYVTYDPNSTGCVAPAFPDYRA